MGKSRLYLLNAIESELPPHQLPVFWEQLQGRDLTTVSMMDLCRAYLATVKAVRVA